MPPGCEDSRNTESRKKSTRPSTSGKADDAQSVELQQAKPDALPWITTMRACESITPELLQEFVASVDSYARVAFPQIRAID